MNKKMEMLKRKDSIFTSAVHSRATALKNRGAEENEKLRQ